METGFSSDIAIAVESVLLTLTTLLAIYSISDKKQYPASTSIFLVLLVMFMWIEITVDLTSYILDAVCYSADVKYLLYHIAYIFSNLIPWAFARSVIYRVDDETGTNTVTSICDAIMIASNFIVVISAPFGLLIESISPTVSIAGPLYPVLFICPFALIAISIVMAFKIHSFPYLWRFSTIFLGVASLVATLLKWVFPAMPMTVLAQTLGVTGMVLTTRSVVVAESKRKVAELAAAKAALAEEKNAALVSQIKPHFVQNSLLAIAYLCEEDPKAAKELTLDFARYLRGNIDSINGADLIPFSKELEHTKTYLSIERARFGDTFQIVYDIQEQDFLVPPLSVQPLVENAFKHGISPLPENGTIWISTQKSGDRYLITIRDNGVGFDPEAEPEGTKSHVGVSNTRNRISALLGGILNVETGVDFGTKITIEIPISQNKEEVR